MKDNKPKVKKQIDIKAANPKHYKKPSELAIALSVKHLSLMLKSGLALEDSIAVLAEQASDAKLGRIYAYILTSIQGGKNLGDSMKDFPKAFSDVVISIVSVGEEGGTLETNLIFLADYLKKQHELSKKVKGALLYPGIVFFLTIGEMIGVIFLILPKLQDLFSTFSNIPPFTKAVLKMTGFIRSNYLLLGGLLLLVIVLLKLFLSTKRGKIVKDNVSLGFPVIKKLTQDNLLASFARTINILLDSGMPIERALEITSSTIGNSVYIKVLAKVVADVKSGTNIAEALEKFPNQFPGTFVKMIEVGEQTGTLSENLYSLYEFHAEEVADMSNNLTTLLEPILLIFIGVMIGGLAIIIIGPIYQFTGSING